MATIEQLSTIISQMESQDIQQFLSYLDEEQLNVVAGKMGLFSSKPEEQKLSMDYLKKIWKINIDHLLSITANTIQHVYPDLYRNNQQALHPYIVHYDTCRIAWHSGYVVFKHIFKYTVKNIVRTYIENGGFIYDKHMRGIAVLKYNPINIKTTNGSIPYETLFFKEVLHKTTEQQYCENTECCVCYEDCNIAQQCGHNTCSQCVDQIVENGTFKCPLCRKTEQIGLNLIYDPHPIEML
jgi:hypothetical protein